MKLGTIDRKMAPPTTTTTKKKDVHVLIPGDYEYVILHSKRILQT